MFNMPKTSTPDMRLSEFIGLRLTIDERRAAERLAERENKTLTALFRELLAERLERDRRNRKRFRRRSN